MIVPRSSVLVHEDAEYGLYSATMFHKVVEEFKKKSREKKWELPLSPSLELTAVFLQVYSERLHLRPKGHSSGETREVKT